MKKQEKLMGLKAEVKAELAKLSGYPEFQAFVQFLRNEQNNIVMLEWFKIEPSDPLIREKKAFYKGRFEEIKAIIKTFEECRQGKEE